MDSQVLLAAFLFAAAVACDRAGPKGGPLTPSAAGGDATPSPRAEAGTAALPLVVGGVGRVLLVHSPPGAAAPAALVLNLHGSGGTAAAEETFSGMDAAADAKGFLVAYPQGAIPLGSGYAWNVPGQPLLGGGAVPPNAADDVAFLAEAIAAIERAYSVDPKRVYATGMSGGARMTSQLGCDLSTLVAAIAPVAGLRFPSPCQGSRPVPVVAFHGTADTVNPYDGGGQPYWTESVPAAAQEWAAHDGCARTPNHSVAAPQVDRTFYPGCASSTAVELYTIDGAGHEWPGAAGQTNAIDATSVMWSFFTSHTL